MAAPLLTLDTDFVKMHGFIGCNDWLPPIQVTSFDAEARTTFTSIKAHEFVDQTSTMREKVKLLADLIRRAERCVAYTGAGISTAAGIDDYASKAKT